MDKMKSQRRQKRQNEEERMRELITSLTGYLGFFSPKFKMNGQDLILDIQRLENFFFGIVSIWYSRIFHFNII